MAYEPYTRTNQKLHFCGLALENWLRAERDSSFASAAQIQAEREAALFHLHGALLALCHEIAHSYRLPDASWPALEHFLDEHYLSRSPCPELSELFELSRQSDSWLACACAAYRLLLLPPQAPRKIKQDATLALIQAVNLDEQEDEPPLSRETIQQWRGQLKALVLRFRDSLTEI